MARILIVDDDEMYRTTLRRLITRRGHTVEEAANGREALERVAAADFDVVVTDIVMPEKEGIETIVEMRGAGVTAGIIAISGGGRVGPDSYLSLASSLGADRVLKKPVANADLMAAIAAVTGAQDDDRDE